MNVLYQKGKKEIFPAIWETNVRKSLFIFVLNNQKQQLWHLTRLKSKRMQRVLSD